MFWRVLGGVGRALIAAGVILLLFVAYQLWGTGLQTQQAQNRLEDQFEEQIEALGEGDTAPSTTPPTTAPSPNGSTPTTAAPTPTTDTVPLDGIPEVAAGEVVGRINIPAIGSDWYFVEDTDLRYLKEGPGHFLGTRYPGQAGNAALAGHRTTYGAPFHRQDELVPGDEIQVTTLQGEFTYRVLSAGELSQDMPFDVEPGQEDAGHFIIGPSDSWILDDYGDNRITLMACHPKYSARQRIVTVGELVDAPAPTPDELPERDDAAFDDLAGGDDSMLLPAILWGLAAGAVWFSFWFLGRVWKRWPAYLIGTPVFLVVLFGCFTYVEQLLPASY
jgi:sortase A